MDGPASISNSNLKFRQFPGDGGLRNFPQPDRSTELSANPLQDVSGIVDSNQEPDYSESSDSEQEPRPDADIAWQDQSHQTP